MHTALTEGLTCTWSEMQDGVVIKQNNDVSKTVTSPDECKKACEDENTFVCLSAEFRESDGKCSICRFNSSDIPLTAKAGFVYWDRSCPEEQSTTGNYLRLLFFVAEPITF